jgi:hypothetical protein
MPLALFLECGAKAIQAGLPQATIRSKPRFQLSEGLRPQRVKAQLPLRPHRDEARLVEDSQVAGHARLVNSGWLDQLSDLSLALPQRCDDAPARGVGERLERVNMHDHIYLY